ncbi:hypothetical protein ACLB2K_075319 [Fragaria x ananassa]
MVHMQETSRYWHDFYFVIPGSEIPEWFKNNLSVGGSVIDKLHLDASNSKFIAVCALFLPGDNPSVFRFTWYNYSTGACLGGFCFDIYPGFSDHLMCAVLPKFRFHTCNEVKFVFEINGCKKEVKQCGSRALYEHDMEELIGRMNQSKCNISVYEATDEQEEGAMVKATTSRSGGSDDEYYSAEE